MYTVMSYEGFRYRRLRRIYMRLFIRGLGIISVRRIICRERRGSGIL